MRCRFVLFAGLAQLIPGSVAHSAPQPALTAAIAEKMATACIAYAKEHNGAVNIWIYDVNGEIMSYQRMDGAPPNPPLQEFELRDGFGFDPNRSVTGGVSVLVGGKMVGTAKAVGMGPAGDLACALTAARAAN
jgi:uncharacterized protein GlcG (DUF336 family)